FAGSIVASLGSLSDLAVENLRRALKASRNGEVVASSAKKATRSSISRHSPAVLRQPVIRERTGGRSWGIGNATGVIACERAHVGPEIASGRTRLRRSGRGLAIYVDVGMADVFEDLRRRGARSGDAGHPLRVALRSRPWSAAGRPLAPARPWPKIDEFWTCDSRRSRQSEFGGDGVH